MKIWLAGDSWACGEWNPECTKILHGGLAQYLQEDGHQVRNLSQGGLSNLDIVHRIKNRHDRYDTEEPDLVLVFQTEYSRDYKHDSMQDQFGSGDWQDLTQGQDLVNRWVERFYIQLSEIAAKFAVPIKIIGGCSDTMPFDNMPQDYPGCDIICQSMTNLILNNNHQIQAPIYSWYTKNTRDLIKKFRHHLSDDHMQFIMHDMERGFQRECLLREHPVFFWPDGIHPNRSGHKILFDFLKKTGIFD